MALLEVKNLGISFGGLRAVDQFEINIKKGQLYGLIGPNGFPVFLIKFATQPMADSIF